VISFLLMALSTSPKGLRPSEILRKKDVMNSKKSLFLRRLGKGAFLQSGIEEIDFEAGGQLKIIGHTSFADTPNLKRIKIPASVESLGEVFFSCVGVDSGLKEINFEVGSQMITLGAAVFHGCRYLQKIEIPASVESLERSFFYGSFFEKVGFENGSQLKTLGRGVFLGNESLKRIKIPASVENLGEEAFFMSGIEVVDFEVGSQLNDIGSKAFHNSTLHSIKIPETTKIGAKAFLDTGCKDGSVFVPGNTICNCEIIKASSCPPIFSCAMQKSKKKCMKHSNCIFGKNKLIKKTCASKKNSAFCSVLSTVECKENPQN